MDLWRQGGRWVVARVGQGLRAPLDLVIPHELDEARAVRFLEDLWHELAGPGQRIVRLDR